MRLKITNPLILLIPICIQFSCGEPTGKTKIDKTQFVATTLEVDISGQDVIMILLANDGTINRSGSGVVDTTDKNMFIGVTNDKVFHSLMETVSDTLLSYCGHPHNNCDTTKPNTKVIISFTSKDAEFDLEFCINGTQNDLPKQIREYIENAIKITDPWYQAQKKLIPQKPTT